MKVVKGKTVYEVGDTFQRYCPVCKCTQNFQWVKKLENGSDLFRCPVGEKSSFELRA